MKKINRFLPRLPSRRHGTSRGLAVLTVLAAVFVHTASADNWYVATNGTGGGTNWADATNSIQGAINASSAGDTVWVSNGVYEIDPVTGAGVTNYPSGTIMTNRVAINKAITVRSANNDPANTIIKGNKPYGATAVRCVYMVNGSSLIGFTLTNGATETVSNDNNDKLGGGLHCQSLNPIISNCVLAGNSASLYGGGAFYGTLYNCTLTGNSAANQSGAANRTTLYNCTLSGNSAIYGGGTTRATLYNCTLISNSADYGGGVHGGTLYNCTIVGNSAILGGGTYSDGGTYLSTLYNCTLVGNQASSQGGGVWACTLINSIIYSNTAPNGTNWYGTVSFTNSCTTTAQVGWATGNITDDPRFIANGTNYGTNHVAGNYRLSADSPCLNAGTNFSWMTNSTDARSKDLDGLRRIDNFGKQVDMGCYERMPSGAMFIIGQ